ncbi:hypothetical protein ABTA40_19910, partial [Acinetobacter baumannii]
VVDTVAVASGGTQALVKALSGPLPPLPTAPTVDADLHAAVNRMLDAAVIMPQRTAPVDDALDGVLLHPVWGLAILAGVMF